MNSWPTLSTTLDSGEEGDQTTWSAALYVTEKIKDQQRCRDLYATSLDLTGGVVGWPKVLLIGDDAQDEYAQPIESFRLLLASQIAWLLDQDTDMLARGAGAEAAWLREGDHVA